MLEHKKINYSNLCGFLIGMTCVVLLAIEVISKAING